MEVLHVPLHLQKNLIGDDWEILAQQVECPVVLSKQAVEQLIGYSHDTISPCATSVKFSGKRPDLVNCEVRICPEVVDLKGVDEAIHEMVHA